MTRKMLPADRRQARGIPFTAEEWKRIATEARKQGMPATVWIRHTLTAALKSVQPADAPP